MAQEWHWTPDAPHHAALCRVNAPDGSQGSGTLVEFDGMRVVITAAHVVEGATTAKATWLDGTERSGPVTVCAQGNDIAVVLVDDPGRVAIAVAPTDARPGDTGEFLTVGGPDARKRTFAGTLIKYRSGNRETEWDAWVIHGDSGGGIVAGTPPQFVGVQSTGGGEPLLTQHDGEAVRVYEQAGVVGNYPIRAFLSRVKARFFAAGNCPGGQCFPNQSAPRQVPQPGGAAIYPPASPYPASPSPAMPAATPPVAPVVDACECDDRWPAIEARVAAIEGELQQLQELHEESGTARQGLLDRLAALEADALKQSEAVNFAYHDDLERVAAEDQSRHAALLDRIKSLAGDATQQAAAAAKQYAADAIGERVQEVKQSVLASAKQHVGERLSERVGAFEGLSWGKLAAGVLGLGGLPALAVSIAIPLALRKLKNRGAGVRDEGGFR
jgi:hypothetical protein